MTEEYVQVVPSTDTYDHEAAVDVLQGFQRFSTPPDQDSLLARLFGGKQRPTYEFLALCAGEDAPVEFYYGADGMGIETLQTELRNCYPRSFEVSRTELDPLQRLIPHVEYEPASFLRAVRNDALWASPDVETPGEIVTDENAIEAVRDALHPTQGTPTSATLAGTDEPVYTQEDTVIARPSVEQLTPVGVRWHGLGVRRRDWMCPLRPYHEIVEDGPPLASLIDQIGEATIPLGFQVVFRRRLPWGNKQTTRISDIKRGDDTRLGAFGNFVNEALTSNVVQKKDREDLSSRDREHLSAIESADPSNTFDATVRALTFAVDGVDTNAPGEERPVDLNRLRASLAPIDGSFYGLCPVSFREEGLIDWSRERNARQAFKRFLDGDLYVDESGRSRPHVVATPEELATLVTVPSGEDLSVPATRATRTVEESQTPLPRPNPDKLGSFRDGMTIGRAVDDTGEPETEPLRLPPKVLARHYARYGPTGWGKSKAVQRDVLSLYETTGGPTVLVDRKGDGMVKNYLRAHYAAVGDLDDVYHLSIPEALPAIPFFDLRPGLAAGRDRETVIQEKVEHFREILRMVMGEELFDRAFVANEILTFLVRALFDPQYQNDAYGLDDLYDAALRMQQERKMPVVSTAFRDTANALKRQFEKDHQSFQRSMDAVLNRLDKLRENTHLTDVLRRTPEWDTETEQYEPGTFDFRRLLDEDCVVLLDMGELRRESSRALTLLLLSNLWDALQYRQGTREEPIDVKRDGMVNVIIEEAAPMAASRLVQEDLLPQGRSFGLGLGLVMQFPEQVRSVAPDREASKRAVRELANNVGTQIVGGIVLGNEFAEPLIGDDLDVQTLQKRCNSLPLGQWLVDLPETEYLEPPPGLVSMQSLPILPGHPESEQPLSTVQEEIFTDTFETVKRRSKTQFGVRARHADDRHSETTDDQRTVPNTRMPTQETDSERPTEPLDDAVTNATPIDEEPTTGGRQRGQTEAIEDSPDDLLEGIETLADDADTDDGHTEAANEESADAQADADPDDTIGDEQNDTVTDDRDGDTARDDEDDDTAENGSDDPEPRSESTGNNDGGDATENTTDDPERHSEGNEAEAATDDGDDSGTQSEGTAPQPPESTDTADDGPVDGADGGEAQILRRVLTAMNGDLGGYSLHEGMHDLVNADGAVVDDLIDDGLLERHHLGDREYYTVTAQGCRHLDTAPATVDGIDDLVEKTPHRVGVTLLRDWLAARPAIDRVATYHEHDGIVYDVAAYADDELVWVGEVQTRSQGPETITEDYHKLADVDAQTVWAVPNRESARVVLTALSNAEIVSAVPTGDDAETMIRLGETVAHWDTPGLDELVSYRQCRSED